MRNVVLFIHVSLDGFCSGPKGELDWVSYDSELEKYAEGIVSTVGSPLYGRVTYQMMESYWPAVLRNKSATKHERDHANWVENVHKVVFSRTLDKVEWKNTQLIKDNITEEITTLKQQPGKDLVIFGSPTLAHEFMRLDLIDEYQLTLNPVLLGRGTPLFENVETKSKLTLVNSTTLNSGVMGLQYRRARER